MTLQELLHANHEPYFKPAPLHMHVICSKEEDRILSWNFIGDSASPAVTKKDKVAIISDGKSLAKINLFEEFASKISDGKNYYLKGYTLRGHVPPYSIRITRETKFFRSSPVRVSEEMKKEATSLLNPPSAPVHLNAVKMGHGLVTVQGQVVTMAAMKKIRGTIPLRVITVEQDEVEMKVAMWRVAASLQLKLGDNVRLSHLRTRATRFGTELQSTNMTSLEVSDAHISPRSPCSASLLTNSMSTAV